MSKQTTAHTMSSWALVATSVPTPDGQLVTAFGGAPESEQPPGQPAAEQLEQEHNR